MEDPTEQHEPLTLERLPPDLLKRIIVKLPDPAALAATCHATAALLDQDALLLAWAHAWAGQLAPSDLNAQHRHPGYALLHWHRLRCMSTARLAGLLLKWVARHASGLAAQYSPAQQLLDAGDALGALRAALPYSEHVLLPYAAQSGHTRLLSELLAAPTVLKTVELQWGRQRSPVRNHLVGSAVHAAACNGHVEAMHMLLQALEQSGDMSQAERLIANAVVSGSKGGACVEALSQLSSSHVSHTSERSTVGWVLGRAAASGDASAVTAILSLGLELSLWEQEEAHRWAVIHDHMHLLPLLRPKDMTAYKEAIRFCSASREIRRGDAAALWLLPKAFWQLRKEVKGDVEGLEHRNMYYTLQRLLQWSAAVPVLAAIWASITAPSDRQALAKLILDVMAAPECNPCAEAARWALEHALPSLPSKKRKKKGEVYRVCAAFTALTRGHMDTFQVLLEADPPVKLASTSVKEEAARQLGALRCAVRSGDADATQAALEAAMRAVGAVGPDGQLDFPRTLWEALVDATALSNTSAAEAVVRVLAQHLDHEHEAADEGFTVLEDVLPTHDGRLFIAMHEECAHVRDCIADDGVLRQDALKHGCIALLEWLVRRPGQRKDFLADTLCKDYDTKKHGGFRADEAAALAVLLHRLAAVQSSGNDSTASVDGGQRTHLLAAARWAARDHQPPPGASKLSRKFVERTLRWGRPDLVHALLVYLESWSM